MNGIESLDQYTSEAPEFVYTFLKEKLPPGIYYHTYQHALDVGTAAEKIGKKSGLSREDQALVTLAAWFHDLGYTETAEDHEEIGVRIAATFLESRDADDEVTARVAALIRATRQGHEPADPLEAVIHDADLSHVGSKAFFDRAALLRREWEDTGIRTMNNQEWLELQYRFLSGVRFATDYARDKFEDRRKRNIAEVQNRLAAELAAQNAPAVREKRVTPGRGIETMYRTVYRNHINLSSIADSKANIMISINAILLSIVISFVSTRLATNMWLLVPTGALLVTALTAIVYATLSTRPTVTSRTFTIEDVRTSRSNVLFFGNFVNMPLDEFKLAMHELMEDYDTLYDNMIYDIYTLGQVLSKKYKLLWVSYTVFMAGLTLTVILFLISFFAY